MLVLHSWAVLRMQAVFRGQRARREAGVGSHNPTYIESEDRRQHHMHGQRCISIEAQLSFTFLNPTKMLNKLKLFKALICPA